MYPHQGRHRTQQQQPQVEDDPSTPGMLLFSLTQGQINTLSISTFQHVLVQRARCSYLLLVLSARAILRTNTELHPALSCLTVAQLWGAGPGPYQQPSLAFGLYFCGQVFSSLTFAATTLLLSLAYLTGLFSVQTT